MIVRAARPDDHASFVRFFAELRIDDPVPDMLRWTTEIAPDAFFVVAPASGGGEESLVGYGVVRPMEGIGHVVHVVADPAHRGRGVGMLVMEHAAARLRAAGCSEWYLAVKPDNAPAIRLYARCGMRRMHASVAFEIAWSDVSALAADAALVARELDTSGAEDDRVATRHGLSGAHLASARTRRSVVIGAFDAAGDAVGLAAFNPYFPGAFPFRAARGGVARVLLEGMRPFARAEHAAARVVAENDAALVAELRAAGAVTKLEFEQMRGAIPGATEFVALRNP